jgi:hypothetical protein
VIDEFDFDRQIDKLDRSGLLYPKTRTPASMSTIASPTTVGRRLDEGLELLGAARHGIPTAASRAMSDEAPRWPCP